MAKKIKEQQWQSAGTGTPEGGGIPQRKAAAAVSRQYTPRDSSGNDYASLSGMSDLHKAALSAAQNDYKTAKTDEARQAAHNRAEAVRSLYGYSGGRDGSEYNPLGGGMERFTYQSAPAYTNRYAEKLDELSRQILDREPFSYDAEQDPIYQQYKSQYTRAGQRAMDDTLGKIAARTGGMASSYAANAAQGAYDQYMAELSDKVPELYQLAYSMYQDEGDSLRNDLSMLRQMEQDDYGKYADKLGQYNTDRSFAYGQFADDRDYGYQQKRDRISDSRYQQEYADSQKQQTREEAQSRIGDYLAAGGKTANLDQTLIANSGYTQAELAALERYYTLQSLAKAAGSGGSTAKKTDEQTQKMGIYDSLAARGATDYGTAYALLVGDGYSSTEAETMAEYFDNTYYPGYSGTPTWVGDYTRELANAVGHGNITGSVLADAIENAVSSGLMTEREQDWLLTKLGF